VAVAQWTPLYNAVQLMRGLASGEVAGLGFPVLYLLTLATALSVFAITRMRRRVIV
jgi:hypothetical protein